MNSNPTSYKRFPPNFRETFGIKRKNGQTYKDIISSFLIARNVTVQDISYGYIHEPSRNAQNLYVIHTDFETYNKIIDEGQADCIISFQKRKTGNFAMIRLFKKELSNVS